MLGINFKFSKTLVFDFQSMGILHFFPQQERNESPNLDVLLGLSVEIGITTFYSFQENFS